MKQLNQRDAIHYISTRQEFKASALMGTFAHIGSGRLNTEEFERYNQTLADGANYFVYSYGTPIAWHTAEGWYVVEQKFSVTTSKHQNYVRRAIADSLQGVN
jgi:hypothetical protein